MTRDVKLVWKDESNAFDISFSGGDIESDYTISTPVWAQIFTRARLEDYEQPNKFLQQGWLGNIFFDNFIAGCKFEYISSQGDLSQNTINSLINEIRKALKFLFDLNIAEDIIIDISTNPVDGTIKLNIKIIEKSGQITILIQEFNL